MLAAVTGVAALITTAAQASLPPRERPPRPDVDYRPPPTQQEVSAVVSANRPAIKLCYQRALLGDKSLADGRVVLTLTIGISGKPKQLHVDGPPQFRQLEPCLRKVVASWVFPQASEEYGTQFPLVFQAGEDPHVEDQSGRQMCSVSISSVPWSELWLDGKSTGRRTPVVDYKVPCGKHKLGLKRPEWRINKTKLIRLRRGEPFDRSYTLMPKTAGRR
jgi:hypothetical protein